MAAKKQKVLLVEDEAIVRESLRDWLIEDGYDVECVDSGEEALKRVKQEEFGVIVLDLRLPGIDGLQGHGIEPCGLLSFTENGQSFDGVWQ